MAFFTSESQTFQEASRDDISFNVMNNERKIIEKNSKWIVVDKPWEKEMIGLKWVYKLSTTKMAQCRNTRHA